MRRSGKFAATIALSACSGEGSSAAPKPTAQAQDDVKGPPESLHWKDTSVPSNLDMLRRAVEEIGYGLNQAGYTAMSEAVDNDQIPTVLVTSWLSPDGNVLVGLHSSLGVTSVSLKRADKQYKLKEPLWYRCAVHNGTQLDMLGLVDQLQQTSTGDLRAKCPIVTFGD